VAKMIENLEINKNCKVLEVGTGSGYQTAILSRLSRRVYSIERHEFLKKKAEELLLKNYFKNVTCIFGDGSLGMEHQAPFDRIIISAAAEDIPQKLIEQLKYGGIMVLPVGFSKEEQTLIKVRKDSDQTHYEEIFKVRFVPLVEGSQNIRNHQDG
jgi:protein-L-isoaspartate(D-aspartate) O-methyltransferase